VFARTGTAWAQQGAKLTGGEESGEGYFGTSVALSEDGATALIGGMRDDGERGAAWELTRTGTAWAQQGAKLTGGEEVGKGQLGWSVALSADAATALVGGMGDNGKAGAAWVFAAGPLSPQQGDSSSGGEPTGGQGSAGTPPQTLLATGSPGAGGAAQQGVAAYQAEGGAVVLLSRRLPVRGSAARVRLRCAAATTCRARLVLTVAVWARAARRSRAIRLATRGFSLEAGATVTVALPLGRGGRARLRAGRNRLRASLTVRLLAPDPVHTHAYAVTLVSNLSHRRNLALRPVA